MSKLYSIKEETLVAMANNVRSITGEQGEMSATDMNISLTNALEDGGSIVSAHNIDTTAHPDIREEISQLSSEIADIDIPTITQEAGNSESLIMSQKAVTDLVSEALNSSGNGNATEYETVDSVDKMTDTSKSYVLSTTGTIWTYTENTVTVEPQNKFVPSTAILNQRLSGSSGSVSANDTSIGSFVTDYIAVKDLGKISPYYTRFNWSLVRTDDNKVAYYNASKSRIGHNIFNATTNYTISNGETKLDISKLHTQGSTPSNLGDVAYVRFQLFVKTIGTALTSSDIANLTIKFDADGGTKTESTWTDTGIAPSSSGGGGNYVNLLVKVNENTSNIAEVSNRVTALETGSDSVTIPSFWQNAVSACISKIKALQVGKNCVTFPFFSDNHQRNGYVGMLITHIMKECGIPYAFFGGDTIDSGYLTENTMISQDKTFDTAMSYIPYGRFCRAVGNHDGFWNDNGTKGSYTRAKIYELFLREEGISQNKHFGDDGTYYYIDDISSKVRFIVLNTNSETISAGSESIDSTQLSWLQNIALKFNESGWAVVIISHCPISNHYHANVTNSTEVISVVNASGVDVVGWFSGHIHRDRMYTHSAVGSADGVEGADGNPLGFTQVTITSDHTGIAYDNATKHTVANDDQSHAIDFVTINKSTRVVNITRLGIGSDRSFTY